MMRIGTLIALACMVAACASSPTPRYYTLAPGAVDNAPKATASYRVAVEDVRAALSYAVDLLDEDRTLGTAPAR